MDGDSMRNREALLSDIKQLLDRLTQKLPADGAPIPSETLTASASVCRHLLSSLYGYSFEDAAVLPDIDFIDPRNRVAVQVRAGRTRQEIQDTVERFQDLELHSKYDTLFILIIRDTPGIRYGFSKVKVNLQIMFLSDLRETITYLPLETLEKLLTDLQQELSGQAQPQPKRLSEFPKPVAITEFTPPLQTILRFAQLLSDYGLDELLFRHGLENQQSLLKALELLVRNHWIVQDGPVLYSNPLAAAETRRNAKASQEELRAFLDQLWNFEQSFRWYRVDSREHRNIYCRLARLFANAATAIPGSTSAYARRSAELWMSADDYYNALARLKDAVKQPSGTEDIQNDTLREKAYLEHLIAYCNEQSNHPEEALMHRQRTLELCKLIPVPHADLAVAHHYVGLARRKLNRPIDHNEAEEQFLCEIKLLENLRTVKDAVFPHSGLAKAYDELSKVYQALGESAKQAYYYHKALAARQEDSGLSDSLLSSLFLSPKHPLPCIQSGSVPFISNSRNAELALLEALLEAGSPVFIHGVGGIGKTEVAAQLALRFPSSKGAYLLKYRDGPDDGDALRATILHAAFTNYSFQGEQTDDREPEYLHRMEILRTEYPGALLFIDDFNSPGVTLAALQKQRTYRELASMGIRLVFISRGRIDTRNSVEITGLDERLLLRLMPRTAISGPDSEVTALELIRAVDRHTLIVSLMANAMTYTEGLTPEKMLNTLRGGNPPRRAETDGEIHHRIYAYLKTLLDLSEMTAGDRDVLACAALLPYNGMDKDLFLACLTQNQAPSVDKLIKYGYIQSDKKAKILRIHSVIREACLRESKASDKIYKEFFKKLRSQVSSAKYINLEQIRQIAECFSVASDKLEDSPPDLAMIAAMHWKVLGMDHNALHYFRRAEDLWGENEDPDGTARAKIHQNLCDIYRNLGQLSNALERLKKALAVYEEMNLPSGNLLIELYRSAVDIYDRLGDYKQSLRYAQKHLHLNKSGQEQYSLAMATAHYTLGAAYIKTNQSSKAISHLNRAINITKKLPQPNAHRLALFKNSLANAYTAVKKYTIALDLRLEALEVLEATLSDNHLDLATAYHNIGVNYSTLDDHYKALEYKLKAMNIRERVLPPEHPHLASVYYSVGDSYHAMGELDRALEYREKALAIRKKALPEKHPDLTDTYSIVAYTYLELREYNRALPHLRNVLAALGDPPTNRLLYAVTNTRLGTIYTERENPDYAAALASFRKALDAFKEEYPTANPDLVTAYSNVGYALLMLGSLQEAGEYLRSALRAAGDIYTPTHPIIQDLNNTIRLTQNQDPA